MTPSGWHPAVDILSMFWCAHSGVRASKRDCQSICKSSSIKMQPPWTCGLTSRRRLASRCPRLCQIGLGKRGMLISFLSRIPSDADLLSFCLFLLQISPGGSEYSILINGSSINCVDSRQGGGVSLGALPLFSLSTEFMDDP